MLLSRSQGCLNKDMQINTKVQISPKTLMFIIRLSAIGDSIIAAQTVINAIQQGLEPVFVTYAASKDIALSIYGLKYWALLQPNGEILLHEINFDAKTNSNIITNIIAWNIFDDCISNTTIILDLQNTVRSNRAIKAIKKQNTKLKFITLRVKKRLVYRIWQICKTYLSIKRTCPTNSLYNASSAPQNIYDINKNLLETASKYYPSLPSIEASNAHFIKPSHNLYDNYIAIFIGASGPLKAWPIEHFIALVKKIINETDYKVLIIGGKAEQIQAEKIAVVDPQKVTNLCGSLTLLDTINVIAHANYTISGDSFPSHICKMLNLPATIIFGATSPLFGFAPIGKYLKIRYLNMSCSPCTRHGFGQCHYNDLWCLRGILVDDVFSDISSL